MWSIAYAVHVIYQCQSALVGAYANVDINIYAVYCLIDGTNTWIKIWKGFSAFVT